MDFVFTVCDSAANEACPVWPGQPMTAHWGIEDPAAVTGTEDRRRQAFRSAALLLWRRIELFLSLPLEKLDHMARQARDGGDWAELSGRPAYPGHAIWPSAKSAVAVPAPGPTPASDRGARGRGAAPAPRRATSPWDRPSAGPERAPARPEASAGAIRTVPSAGPSTSRWDQAREGSPALPGPGTSRATAGAMARAGPPRPLPPTRRPPDVECQPRRSTPSTATTQRLWLPNTWSTCCPTWKMLFVCTVFIAASRFTGRVDLEDERGEDGVPRRRLDEARSPPGADAGRAMETSLR